MPTIFFHCPKLDQNQRREIVKSFTETASKVTGIEKKAFVVYLNETERDCVGVGGELLCDRDLRTSKA